MKIRNLLSLLSLSVVFVFVSCETEPIELEDNAVVENTTLSKSKKGKPGSLKSGTYTISSVENPSALYSFTVSGKNVLLQSNPNEGNWGTDYYGFWSNTFRLKGNKIEYTSGLSTITYQFNVLNNNNVTVIRTVVTNPYQSNGEITTTVTSLGVYSK